MNCFQKLLSSWHETTRYDHQRSRILLWIAFKNYYLRDTKQQVWLPEPSPPSCELLSKIIIFVTRNNSIWDSSHHSIVVNCFQKLLSSWHETTFLLRNTKPAQLWIAFKNYYLRDTKQLFCVQLRTLSRCELLSKIIIFVTRNNQRAFLRLHVQVVNCFQKLLSSWHETTSFEYEINKFALWIAFKNYYLRDTKQH